MRSGFDHSAAGNAAESGTNMKRLLLTFLLLSFIQSIASAQDDECYACNNEYDNSYTYDEEWTRYQEQLIREGYGTIFDTEAYQNGDYYIREDGRVALGEDPNNYYTRPTTEEERQEIEREYYDNNKPIPTPKPYKYIVTWKCVDATSYDGIANNDNKCTSSTGQVKYVSDSEAKKLDPKYKPGKSGAWYYNNK